MSIKAKLRTLLGLALSCISLALSATEAPPDPAQEAALMEQKLVAGLGRLEPFAGRWSIVAEQHDENQRWQEQERSELSFDWVLGNRLLETSGNMMGADFRLSLSFDVYKSVYRLALIDSGSGVFDVYEGGFDSAGTLVLTNPDFYQWQLKSADVGWELNYLQSKDQGQTYVQNMRNQMRPVAD